LRNVLTRNIPVIGARAVAQVTCRLLDRHGLALDDIAWWVVHPGGTQVLKAVGKQLELAPEKLRFSYETFRDYGNMSSPTVMFVLTDPAEASPAGQSLLSRLCFRLRGAVEFAAWARCRLSVLFIL
jgi:alkylresorcinol/alkylpyrone synthase